MSQKYLYSSDPSVSLLVPQSWTVLQPAIFHHFQGKTDVKIT